MITIYLSFLVPHLFHSIIISRGSSIRAASVVPVRTVLVRLFPFVVCFYVENACMSFVRCGDQSDPKHCLQHFFFLLRIFIILYSSLLTLERSLLSYYVDIICSSLALAWSIADFHKVGGSGAFGIVTGPV